MSSDRELFKSQRSGENLPSKVANEKLLYSRRANSTTSINENERIYKKNYLTRKVT